MKCAGPTEGDRGIKGGGELAGKTRRKHQKGFSMVQMGCAENRKKANREAVVRGQNRRMEFPRDQGPHCTNDSIADAVRPVVAWSGDMFIANNEAIGRWRELCMDAGCLGWNRVGAGSASSVAEGPNIEYRWAKPFRQCIRGLIQRSGGDGLGTLASDYAGSLLKRSDTVARCAESSKCWWHHSDKNDEVEVETAPLAKRNMAGSIIDDSTGTLAVLNLKAVCHRLPRAAEHRWQWNV